MSWLDAFPDAQTVWTAVPDLNGQARGKRLPVAAAHKLFTGTAKMPLSALSLDVFGDDVEGSPLVFESGDQDGFLRPTERGGMVMPWLDAPAVLLPMTMEHAAGRAFEGDPRCALQRVLDRYAARGWQVQAATELEFYLIDEAAPEPLATRLRAGGDILGLRSLEAYEAFLSDLYAASAAMGIPAETATSESGRNQFEVTLAHGPAMDAADNTWLFKMLAKGIARQHGMVATFMAKPYAEDAGSGMHLHFSVLDPAGQNVFDSGDEAGSQTLHLAVAGCLATMADATLIFAPHENSYQRPVPGSHAPTAISWGYENRTVALRIPAGPGTARRIEHRVAGGDINPYLMFAAVLGGAMLGIEDDLTPPASLEGNAYEADLPQLAATWAEAIDRFEASAAMKRVFHDMLIDLFVGSKRQDARRLQALDADARRALYLDRV